MVGWDDLVLPPVQRRCSVSGKGDTPRPVNAEVYGQNYEDIFRKDKPQTTEPNETENKTDP
jgi:hypothetical protein